MSDHRMKIKVQVNDLLRFTKNSIRLLGIEIFVQRNRTKNEVLR